jgi:hypothetical protein
MRKIIVAIVGKNKLYDFFSDVIRQRALALPIVPSIGLRMSALIFIFCVVIDADAWLPAIDALKPVQTPGRGFRVAFYIFGFLRELSHIHEEKGFKSLCICECLQHTLDDMSPRLYSGVTFWLVCWLLVY